MLTISTTYDCKKTFVHFKKNKYENTTSPHCNLKQIRQSIDTSFAVCCWFNLPFNTYFMKSIISPYIYAGLSKPKEELEADSIMLKVCKHFGISVDTLRSKCREREYVMARCYYIYTLTTFKYTTLQKIADSINRDHSSIIHLRDKFKSELEIYEDARIPYKKFLEDINWSWAMAIK